MVNCSNVRQSIRPSSISQAKSSLQCDKGQHHNSGGESQGVGSNERVTKREASFSGGKTGLLWRMPAFWNSPIHKTLPPQPTSRRMGCGAALSKDTCLLAFLTCCFPIRTFCGRAVRQARAGTGRHALIGASLLSSHDGEVALLPRNPCFPLLIRISLPLTTLPFPSPDSHQTTYQLHQPNNHQTTTAIMTDTGRKGVGDSTLPSLLSPHCHFT